jgi:catechol 2,3-dioxygenase-like lactoylglutathione lyase family enzyme
MEQMAPAVMGPGSPLPAISALLKKIDFLGRVAAYRRIRALSTTKAFMTPQLDTILIYARNPAASAEFYRRHFGFLTSGEMVEGLIALSSPQSGAGILIHQAAKSLKQGQAGVKLMFSVPDVEAFKAQCARQGLEFGSVHQANGYAFANAKDPDGNSVAISSRAYRQGA